MENSTINLQLQYPDGRLDEQDWDQADFDKITLFKALSIDLPCTENKTHDVFLYPVERSQNYITHEYLKNLITGNFIDFGLTRYINDYNFFIGHDIQLEPNEKYFPVILPIADRPSNSFISSLKWRIFKDNEDFFRVNMKFGPQPIKEILKAFMYPTAVSGNLRDAPYCCNLNLINLSIKPNDERFKLSLISAFSFDYTIFEKSKRLCDKTRQSITWLDLNNSFLLNLNLSELLECFPNLRKLTVKNTFIEKITEKDIETLKSLRNNSIRSNSPGDKLWPFLDENEILDKFALRYRKLDNPEIAVEEHKQAEIHAEEINLYSFILDLRGCPIKNSEIFSSLLKNESNTRYKKSIYIKGVKTKELSSFKKLFARFLHVKKHVVVFLIASTVNLILITKLFKKISTKFYYLPLGVYILFSFVAKRAICHDLYRKTYLINSCGCVLN